MDNNLEDEIITIIQKDIEKFGHCSIKQAAHSALYDNISLSEQKRIAGIVVKTNPFVTETKNGEIIVKKNLLFTEIGDNTKQNYDLIKSVIAIIVAILAYLVFHVFLPSLH